MRSLSVRLIAAAIVSFLFGVLPGFAQQDPSLLPPASSFRLTLKEEPKSKLPPGPACGGYAAQTMTCRVFSLKVENLGTQTVRLGALACAGPEAMVEGRADSLQKAPPQKGSPEWRALSGWARGECPQLTPATNSPERWQNVRLRPGKAFVFTGRYLLNSLLEWPLAPGVYPLRAKLNLRGCTEDASGADCLAPLETYRPGNVLPLWDMQNLTLVSETLAVTSPPEPDYGTARFEISLATQVLDPADPSTWPAGWKHLDVCTVANVGSLDCVLLHYTVRNVTGRALRVLQMGCDDFSLLPQYRSQTGEWVSLKSTLMFCTANMAIWTKMLPNETFDRFVTVRRVAAGYDVNPIREAGDYDMRLLYASRNCIASPDGNFCVSTPKDGEQAISEPVHIHTTATRPEERTGYQF